MSDCYRIVTEGEVVITDRRTTLLGLRRSGQGEFVNPCGWRRRGRILSALRPSAGLLPVLQRPKEPLLLGACLGPGGQDYSDCGNRKTGLLLIWNATAGFDSE